jgi:hypothetical protein
MRDFLRARLFLIGLILAVPALAQNPRPSSASFSLAVSLPQTSASAGSPVHLDMTVTNISGHKITFVLGCRDAYDFDIRDDRGHSANETEKGMMAHMRFPKGMDPQKIAQAASTACLTVVGHDVEAGKSYDDQVNVADYYDLSKPGRYTIQAQVVDPETKILVKSNTVTLTVTP